MLTLRDCFVILTLLGVALALSREEVSGIGVLVLFIPGAFAVWLFCRRGRWPLSSVLRTFAVSLAGACSSTLLLWLIDWGQRLSNPLLASTPDRMYFGPVLLLATFWGASGGGTLAVIADLVVRDSGWDQDR